MLLGSVVPGDETGESGNGTTPVVLDERLAALLDQIVPTALRPRLQAEGVAGLSDAERTELAIQLMRSRNKVTHTYEFVRRSDRPRKSS